MNKSPRKISVGIIGCGKISQAYFNGAKTFDVLDIVACADLNEAVAQAKAQENGCQALSIEALLAHPDIQIVVNLTIPTAHAAVSRDVLNAGNLDKLRLLANLPPMRLLIPALASFLFFGCASVPKEALTSIEIREVKPRYIEADQLTRASEYFTGEENKGKRILLRSTTGVKIGYYFTLILDEKVRRLPKGTVIIGEFFTPDSVDMQTYEFKLPNRRPNTREIFVGLTGDDWPDRQSVPAAWRFSIRGPNGNTLAETQSFLWSL